MKHETIKVGDKEAVVLIPKDARELAVVDLSVLNRLIQLLPSARLLDIKSNLKERIDYARDLEQVVAIMEEEVAFHRSVNFIEKFMGEHFAAVQQIAKGYTKLIGDMSAGEVAQQVLSKD